ncbi:MAG: DUF3073 domain-containing protein [Actinomycetales bacterium]
MGRGRAKAKQTKVARALKYGGPQTDLQRLQAELSGSQGQDTGRAEVDEVVEDPYSDDPYADDPYADDPYAKYYEDDTDDDADEADGPDDDGGTPRP